MLFPQSSSEAFHNLIDPERLRLFPLQPFKVAGDRMTSGKHFAGLSQPVMLFVYLAKMKVTVH